MQRACDSCRRRKVKCDALQPQCSNCRMSSKRCEYTAVPRKRGRPRLSKDERRRSRHGGGSFTEARGHPGTCSPGPVSDARALDGLYPAPMSPQSPLPVQPQSDYHIGHCHRARDELVSTMAQHDAQWSIDELLSSCIDLYMQWWFPTTPVLHEDTVRRNVPMVAQRLRQGVSHDAGNLPCPIGLQDLRMIALLTASGAVVLSVLPHDLVRGRSLLAEPLLRVSQEVLRVYQDRDLEQSDSTSIIIRFFHSNCLHALGKTRMSWLLMGESLRLAQEMRLHDESSYTTLQWPESQLRRQIFWQLYIADKSASILNDTPVAIHQVCYPEPITAHFDTDNDPKLMTAGREDLGAEMQQGFRLCFQLWLAASDLLLDLNTLSRLESAQTPDGYQTHIGSLRAAIVRSYLGFTVVLDTCSEWHHQPPRPESENIDAPIPLCRTRALWVQHANLYVTFHSLRLVLFSKFTERGYSELLGVTSDVALLALRKTEIASDLVEVVTHIPTWALVANGESCVEKLRQVGVVLLETIHLAPSEYLVIRAKSLVSRLLDILARLNSRVADELR